MSVAATTRASQGVVLPAPEQEKDAPPKRSTIEVVDLPEFEDSFPDGGRGWLVVLGCFIYSASTVGWGCVAPVR
ncbi:hypothetical protein DICSQDRAFT_137804 [Dichomitus squalens LYAD-421 SS1]|uniref:Uncharacterized protein n=1 Tax=Dichomitus squalens (strain LYAD-421) TaxID=732165 RepID=R7SVI9_DICSQ|nr:uncharacterized protein DICSQDRAFT_137804 [Dichomitus squalens LYAD-421 SS1]EJF60189.1 hypothetical protein DICSQDRAFT_137804 [Dichomitus squalens LYAD-421 SS1]